MAAETYYHTSVGNAEITLIAGDALKEMSRLKPSVVDAVITDPPYGIDMDKWDKAGALDPSQPAWAKHPNPRRRSNVAFQAFSGRCANEAYRVLRPGSYVLAFAAARTYHRMACAVEDVGFDVRDMVEWFYGQGWARQRGVQLKPSHEPAVLGQKLPARRSAQRLREVEQEDGRYPANVVLDDKVAAFLGSKGGYFYCAKPSESERGVQNDHPTVKPVELMRWLVRLYTPPGGLVLDPFVGSGTTALACLLEGRSCIGIDSWDHALEISRERIDAMLDSRVSPITGEFV